MTSTRQKTRVNMHANVMIFSGKTLKISALYVIKGGGYHNLLNVSEINSRLGDNVPESAYCVYSPVSGSSSFRAGAFAVYAS